MKPNSLCSRFGKLYKQIKPNSLFTNLAKAEKQKQTKFVIQNAL